MRNAGRYARRWSYKIIDPFNCVQIVRRGSVAVTSNAIQIKGALKIDYELVTLKTCFAYVRFTKHLVADLK